jgi:hypothetical protein
MKKLFSKAKTAQSCKAVFSVIVEFNYQYQKNINNDKLQSGGRYYFKKRKEENNYNKQWEENGITYENISDFITGVIVSDLASICNQYLDEPIEINVNGKYEGSLVLVFSAIFNAVQFISSVKDIYDMAQLIRDLAEERIEKRLNSEYGEYFDVNVKQRLPLKPDRDYYFELERLFKNGKGSFMVSSEYSKNQRDAFFWYLLGCNIVFAGIIVLLVIKALLKVYW